MHIRNNIIAATIVAGATIASGAPTASNAGPGFGLQDRTAPLGDLVQNSKIISRAEPKSLEQWCHRQDTDRLEIWGHWDLDVGGILDDYITQYTERDWVKELSLKWKEASNMVCGDDYANSECSTSTGCKDYYYAGQADIWWIFRAVEKFYRTLGAISNMLDGETLGTTLQIENIIETFGEDMASTLSPWAILSSAFGVAGAAAAPNPPAAAGLGVFSGLASLVGELTKTENETPNNRKGVEDALSKIYEAQKESITMLRNLVIHGEWKRNGDYLYTTQSLPMQTGTFLSPIAKFFDGGKWLLDGDMTEELLNKWKNSYRKNAKRGIITSLLKKQGYFVYIMLDVKDKYQCDTEYDDTIRTWIDGHGCTDFFKFTSDKFTKGQSAFTVDKEMIKKMATTEFGDLDFKVMFENAINCAKQFPDGSATLSRNELYEELPNCFYSYPVVEGNDMKLGNNVRQIFVNPNSDQINTSGRTHVSW